MNETILQKLVAKLFEFKEFKDGKLFLNLTNNHFSFYLSFKDNQMYNIVKDGSFFLDEPNIVEVISYVFDDISTLYDNTKQNIIVFKNA